MKAEIELNEIRSLYSTFPDLLDLDWTLQKNYDNWAWFTLQKSVTAIWKIKKKGLELWFESEQRWGILYMVTKTVPRRHFVIYTWHSRGRKSLTNSYTVKEKERGGWGRKMKTWREEGLVMTTFWSKITPMTTGNRNFRGSEVSHPEVKGSFISGAYMTSATQLQDTLVNLALVLIYQERMEVWVGAKSCVTERSLFQLTSYSE